MTTHSQTDVLIVGAGPSGLMAAQALARLGVKVQIVDQREPGTQYGNADGLNSRTLEIWQSYGMLDKFASDATAMHAIVTYEKSEDGNGLIRAIPSRNVVVNCRYPYELTASIETIEQTLRSSMEEANTRVMQPILPLSIDVISEATDSAEVSHPVKVVLRRISPQQDSPSPLSTSNGSVPKDSCDLSSATPETEVVYAKYVIGADGAHSWVRRHVGIPTDGNQTEYVWGVTDVTLDTDFPDCRFKCVIQSSKGAVGIIPREGEKIRIYVSLSPEDGTKTSDGRLDKSALSPEVVRTKVLERIRECFQPYKVEFKCVSWCSIFSEPQRVASRYSFQDRVFIIGDACHTHSPKAGQGANASIGDAHNLAWKIAYVLRGWAKPSLLDTYEVERRAYALDLIEFDKGIQAVSLNGRNAAEYQSALHEHNMFTSGIGICYKSRLVDTRGNCYALNLRAGERLPTSALVRLGDWHPVELQDLAPSDGLFKLFIFASDILLPNQKARLAEFEATLAKSVCPEIAKLLSIYTILSSKKEDVHWKDVPPLLQSWKRVFVSEEIRTGGVSTGLGVASEGTVILVRPDGYVSMLTELSDTGALQITAFLLKL